MSLLRILFNFRLLVAHTQRTKKKIQNLANHIPAGLWKLCLLWKGVFLMSSEAFWLRNPTMLCVISIFKPGAVEHLDELTTCSQVGRTVWRKVRVCSLCLKGFTQFVTEPQPNINLENFGFGWCFFAVNVSKCSTTKDH